MLAKRIIPCMDIDNGRVVKGTNFINIKDAGDPVELAATYNKQGADELVFLDITASHQKRKTMVDLVTAVAKKIFIPFTVGGGISTIADIRALLNAGADKVSINTAAVKDPAFIKQASEKFGSQCIVLAIDAKKNSKMKNKYEVYIKSVNSKALAIFIRETCRSERFFNQPSFQDKHSPYLEEKEIVSS